MVKFLVVIHPVILVHRTTDVFNVVSTPLLKSNPLVFDVLGDTFTDDLARDQAQIAIQNIQVTIGQLDLALNVEPEKFEIAGNRVLLCCGIRDSSIKNLVDDELLLQFIWIIDKERQVRNANNRGKVHFGVI